ncbi:MAG: hypothetical protein WD492_14735 [Alkalispirochaeta sp.]
MTIGRLLANLFLVGLIPVVVLVVYRREQSNTAHGLVSGIIAAVVVILALLAVRRYVPLSAGAMSTTVVVVEEAAKLCAVMLLLRRPAPTGTGPHSARNRLPTLGSTGYSVGAGFATTEHLLYLTAAPSVIVVRILTAGIIHLVTARLYSAVLAPRPAEGRYAAPRRDNHPATAPRTTRHTTSHHPSRTVRVAAATITGILLHLSYNLLAHRLDQIPSLW